MTCQAPKQRLLEKRKKLVTPSDPMTRMPMPSAENPTIERALALSAETGWPVFPCRAVTKSPATPHGFEDAQRDPALIRRLWRRHPGDLIGVPTGPITGITVLDVDKPLGMIWFASHTHRLPDTRIHLTRRGGYHLIYQTPEPPLRNSAGKIARGIDVRGEGGYVIWWPAHGGEVVNESDIAPWPGWLTAALKRKDTLTKKRSAASYQGLASGDPHQQLDRLIRFVAASTAGERNTRLFWASCRAGKSVKRGELGPVEAERGLFAAASEWPDQRKTISTIRSGLSRG